MKSSKYLEDLKQTKGFQTDKELAELLKVTKAAISQYKSGARIMENETCLAIALELEIDPMRIIMAADIDRAERTGQHSLWEVFSSKKLEKISASFDALLRAANACWIRVPAAA